MKINTLFHDHENAINKKLEIDIKFMGFLVHVMYNIIVLSLMH